MNPKDLVPGQQYYLENQGIVTYLEPRQFGGYLFKFPNLDNEVVLGQYKLYYLRPLTKLDHLLAGVSDDE
jgi:hypothetical protein